VADGQLARHIQEENPRVVTEHFVTPPIGAVARLLVRHSLHHDLQAKSNVQRELFRTVHREKQRKRHSLWDLSKGAANVMIKKSAK